MGLPDPWIYDAVCFNSLTYSYELSSAFVGQAFSSFAAAFVTGVNARHVPGLAVGAKRAKSSIMAKHGITPVGALKVANYDQWFAQVKAAIIKHSGQIPEAAKSLGVSARTVFRWVSETPALAKLGLWERGRHRTPVSR